MSGRIVLSPQQQIDLLIAEKNELKKELSNARTTIANLREECALVHWGFEQILATSNGILKTLNLAIYNRTKKE